MFKDQGIGDQILILQGVAVLGVVTLAIALGVWSLMEYQPDFPEPWNWLSTYYYLGFKKPLILCAQAYWAGASYIWQFEPTNFPNLNLILRLFIEFAFLMISIMIFAGLIIVWLIGLPVVCFGIGWGAVALFSRKEKGDLAETVGSIALILAFVGQSIGPFLILVPYALLLWLFASPG